MVFTLVVYIFSIWFLFYEYIGVTGQQGKEKAVSLTTLYRIHPLYRHLEIKQALTAESSPLHIVSRRTRTENLLLPSAGL